MTDEIFRFLKEAAVTARGTDSSLVSDDLLDEVLRIGIRNQSLHDRGQARADIRAAIRQQVRVQKDL